MLQSSLNNDHNLGLEFGLDCKIVRTVKAPKTKFQSLSLAQTLSTHRPIKDLKIVETKMEISLEVGCLLYADEKQL